MFKKISFIIILGALLISACGAAPEDVEVHSAWARPTLAGENAAVYFLLHNHTDTVHELIGASSNVADVLELHLSKMENDVMIMEMQPSVTLNPDDEVMFEPGGLHVMLISIKEELKLGDHFGIILHFADHEDIVVDVTVQEGPAEEHEDH